MSTVRHQSILHNIFQPCAKSFLVSSCSHQKSATAQWFGLLLCSCLLFPFSSTWAAEPAPVNQEELLTTVREYANAVGKGDRVAAGQTGFHLPVSDGPTTIVYQREFSRLVESRL